jgi:hypothetical protein
MTSYLQKIFQRIYEKQKSDKNINEKQKSDKNIYKNIYEKQNDNFNAFDYNMRQATKDTRIKFMRK